MVTRDASFKKHGKFCAKITNPHFKKLQTALHVIYGVINYVQFYKMKLNIYIEHELQMNHESFPVMQQLFMRNTVRPENSGHNVWLFSQGFNTKMVTK